MERPRSFAQDMLNSISSGKLFEFWKSRSPDRPVRFPWPRVEELPQKDHLQMSGIIEIIGLSGSGKTEAINSLTQNYISRPEVIIRPELKIYDADGYVEDWGKDHKLRGMMLSEFGIKHQMLIWDHVKLASHMYGVCDLAASNMKKRLIIERGANDVISTTSFTFPEHCSIRYEKDYEKDLLSQMFLAIQLAEEVDAVVLYGTDWETAKQRRINQGERPEGELINSKNWPEIISGYEWWLGSFFPVFQRRNGMGILIIDGRDDLETNNKKVLEFCNKVFNLCSNTS